MFTQELGRGYPVETLRWAVRASHRGLLPPSPTASRRTREEPEQGGGGEGSRQRRGGRASGPVTECWRGPPAAVPSRRVAPRLGEERAGCNIFPVTSGGLCYEGRTSNWAMKSNI